MAIWRRGKPDAQPSTEFVRLGLKMIDPTITGEYYDLDKACLAEKKKVTFGDAIEMPDWRDLLKELLEYQRLKIKVEPRNEAYPQSTDHRNYGHEPAARKMCEQNWEIGSEFARTDLQTRQPQKPACLFFFRRSGGHLVAFFRRTSWTHRRWMFIVSATIVRLQTTWCEGHESTAHSERVDSLWAAVKK